MSCLLSSVLAKSKYIIQTIKNYVRGQIGRVPKSKRCSTKSFCFNNSWNSTKLSSGYTCVPSGFHFFVWKHIRRINNSDRLFLSNHDYNTNLLFGCINIIQSKTINQPIIYSNCNSWNSNRIYSSSKRATVYVTTTILRVLVRNYRNFPNRNSLFV